MKIEITQSNFNDSFKYFNDQLTEIINKNINDINNIISNGNICGILLNKSFDNLKLNKSNYTYNIGTFNKLDVFIDALQLWSDNIIYLRKDDNIIIKIEIIDKNNVLI